MLYHLYELQHATISPLRMAVDANKKWLRNPANPLSYTQPGRAVAAACDMFTHITHRYGKPEFGLDTTTVDGQTVAVTEEIVHSEAFCDLLHFKRETGHLKTQPDDPRLLIVAPLSGHFSTLLRGTVEALLPDHDVYITDWIDARTVAVHQGHFDLDTYIDYLMRFLRKLGPNTHVMAVCQPSVPVMAAASLMAAGNEDCQPASMTLMGGPVDTRENPTEVNKFAEQHDLEWFERHVISHVPLPNAGVMRRVYPGFMQLAGFMAMNWDRHVSAHHDMFLHLVEGDGESADAKRNFYHEYLAVMDMTAEFYLQTLKVVFHEHNLPNGTMQWQGVPVDPSAITKTALLTVEGERDDITGMGQTRAAHKLCTNLPDNMRMHHMQQGVGHYGVFNGRRWREQISPRIKEFIRLHDHEGKGARSAPNVTHINAAE
ncbi:polyhydroxyalkanoate depolymerase [Thalassospira lucentensis]|uniref:polyhydroxyalkanoate depolymerase n=1 Tax=Thalassospira lucentensis TaxID=168935 RepID=UPI0003B4E530|nr:polyhydroxyalkanoate depolymerase [Thalassospira lucentensis]RCK23741.1 poly(3-hydroxybutyrate) depolymerase [Thalassospira lucentensis MCCC 1A00383 = DSM 14000]